MLLLGRPGVGKTTVIRELARVMADVQRKRVVIVDTSNEIGGDGDVPHPAIGGARRMQVPDPNHQHNIMVRMAWCGGVKEPLRTAGSRDAFLCARHISLTLIAVSLGVSPIMAAPFVRQIISHAYVRPSLI